MIIRYAVTICDGWKAAMKLFEQQKNAIREWNRGSGRNVGQARTESEYRKVNDINQYGKQVRKTAVPYNEVVN